MSTRTYNGRELSNIYSSTRRPFSTYLCNDLVFSGDPVRVMSASTSITGRHGSGKTLVSVEHMITKKRESKILSSDEAFIQYTSSSRYQLRRGVVMGASGAGIQVRDLQDMSEVTLPTQEKTEVPSVGDQVSYFVWTSEYTGQAHTLLG